MQGRCWQRAVPRGRLATARSRVLQACGASHLRRRLYTTTRQRTCLPAWAAQAWTFLQGKIEPVEDMRPARQTTRRPVCMLSRVFKQPTIGGSMTNKKVWFITGAGRGMGVHIAKAALAAGSAVVATGRNTATVIKAVGEADDQLVVKLDVTSLKDAAASVTAAVDRFGGIDVLVNNAGNFYAGFFEEITPQDFRAQVETL